MKLLRVIIVLLFLASPAWAATYHIDPTAGDGGDGSFASPFNEWSDLPAMSSGDDVYFKCATTITPNAQFVVDWTGTSGDQVVIGAYYDDGGAVYGVSGSRPTIDGDGYYELGTDYYGAQIKVAGVDYVEVRDLHIYQAGGIGIELEGDYTDFPEHCVVDNCDVEGAARQGISCSRAPYNYNQITDNDVSGAGYGWASGLTDGTWPVAISISHCPHSYTTISGNYVHENYGEGIGVWRAEAAAADDSGYATIEDNLIWNNRRVDIYIDGTQYNTVRRNICLGAGTSYVSGWPPGGFASTVSDSRYWNHYGIWINSEVYAASVSPAHGNVIYNNLVAGHYAGIGIDTEDTSGELEDVLLYSNTVIDNATNFSIGSRIGSATTSGVEFKNNISLCTSGAACANGSDPSWLDSKITADHNAWTGSVPTYFGDAATDELVDGDDIASTIDFQDIDETTALAIAAEFKLAVGSNLINAGATLGGPYNVDYWGTSRPVGAAYDIGAYEYTAGLIDPSENIKTRVVGGTVTGGAMR